MHPSTADIVLVGVGQLGEPIEIVSMEDVSTPCPTCGRGPGAGDRVAATEEAGKRFARYASCRLSGTFMDGFFAEYRRRHPGRFQ